MTELDFCDIETVDGRKIVSYECISELRKENSELNIIAQPGGQENALRSEADITITGGNRGGGKALAINELVCTPFGFRRIGDLKVGDIISAFRGGMSRVVYVYDQGEQDVYRLSFSDGTYVDCTLDHLWNIKRTGYNHKSRWLNNTGIENEWRVWTTGMIKTFLERQKNGELSKSNSHLLVPLCHPVKFTRSFARRYKPKTDPYIIGALLGDGCMTHANSKGNLAASFVTNDSFIKEEIERCGIDMTKEYVKSNTTALNYCIYDEDLKNDLQELKLIGCDSLTKFIPEYYKYAPLEVRWALVQGMMDTDGYADSRGHCSYSTISPKLAEDMAFILRSLGAYVSINRNKAGYKKDGEYIACNDAYDLYIKMPDTARLFRLPRKKERCKPYNGGGSTYGKRIISCEFIHRAPCRCIKVDQPDGLFVTRDFTVTHNSYTLLMEALKDADKAGFSGLILRNERDDLTNIIKQSYRIFSNYGTYLSSKDLMCWNFTAGGDLTLSYHAGDYRKFEIRFQGREFNFIGVDEITHMGYKKFQYIKTTLRTGCKIRTRIICTCNPDPDSWVAHYIDWWIDENGDPIKERDGKIRYVYMGGDDVTDCVWGDSKEEVYEKCKAKLDVVMKPGDDYRDYILSVTFIRAELDDNKKLPKGYKAMLAGQSDEAVARDLLGNWKFKAAGNDIIKWQHMEDFFNNSMQTGDGVRRCSCDVAFDGGDNLVMWLLVGNHIQDVFCCRADSKTAVFTVKAKLLEWGVREENFTYDLNGVGQTFKGFFPKAMPFNNAGGVEEKMKYLYHDLKAQAAYTFAEALINGEYSINPAILERKFDGKGYKNMTLREILLKERRCIRRDEKHEKSWKLITKPIMKTLIGNSPDFFEALFYSRIFKIKKPYKKPKGLGWL